MTRFQRDVRRAFRRSPLHDASSLEQAFKAACRGRLRAIPCPGCQGCGVAESARRVPGVCLSGLCRPMGGGKLSMNRKGNAHG